MPPQVKYIIKRLLAGVAMLLGLSVLVFLLLRAAPGDPVDAYINPSAAMSPQDLAALRTRFGLDQPLPVQYLAWLRAAITGDLGYSLQGTGDAVLPLVLSPPLLPTPSPLLRPPAACAKWPHRPVSGGIPQCAAPGALGRR